MRVFPGFSGQRLHELLARFPSIRIAVLGDFFLDTYLDIDPALQETSLETGLPARQVRAIRHSPGAAGTVVNNLAGLGVQNLHAIGFTGCDGAGWQLRQDLAGLGCSTNCLFGLVDRFTPTYLKPRDLDRPGLAGEHARYDTKNRRPTTPDTEERILAGVERLAAEIDALIIMDQVEEPDCGVATSRVRTGLNELAARRPGLIVWADSRRHIRSFRGIMIKPNQFEALGLENQPPDAQAPLETLAAAVSELRSMTRAPVFCTAGPRGIISSDPRPTLVPGLRLEGPLDPTGAGDSATAGCVLALAAGADCLEAALLGCLVASITVQQLATTGTARPDQLEERLALWEEQQQ